MNTTTPGLFEEVKEKKELVTSDFTTSTGNYYNQLSITTTEITDPLGIAYIKVGDSYIKPSGANYVSGVMNIYGLRGSNSISSGDEITIVYYV